MFLFYATMAIGILGLMSSFCNTMRVRYLIPVIGVFWLAASIAIGKIENRKILVGMLVLVMILAGASLIVTVGDMDSRVAYDSEKMDFLNGIDNNDSVIVYNTDYGYRILHEDLSHTRQYSLGDTYFYSDDIEIRGNLSEILDDNPDKDVYLVLWAKKKINTEYKNNYTLSEKFSEGHYSFNLVKH